MDGLNLFRQHATHNPEPPRSVSSIILNDARAHLTAPRRFLDCWLLPWMTHLTLYHIPSVGVGDFVPGSPPCTKQSLGLDPVERLSDECAGVMTGNPVLPASLDFEYEF